MKPAVVGLALLPLVFALPTLSEPWGNSEESLNAAIWSLGARNLLEGKGLGTVVLPHGGTRGDGVYAHHPPLAVWLSAVPVALGGWEGGPRLVALLAACGALLLLHRLLRRYFEPRAALVGLAVAAASTFALRYGRLLTTVTLAAPLFLALVLYRDRKWSPLLVALLVLSSWDGVIAAAVITATFTLSGARSAESKGAGVGDSGALRLRPAAFAQGERWMFAAAFAVSLSFVAGHLITASGGIGDLVWQFRWRSTGDDITWLQWLAAQARHVGEGVGPVALAALLTVPFLAPLNANPNANANPVSPGTQLAILLAPGLVMLVLFRQGATRHAFWGYLLILPAAFAVAHVVSRWPKLAYVAALQLVLTASLAVHRLREEHEMNQLGLVAKTLPQRTTVPVFAQRSFHPYVAWYAASKPLTVRTLDELRATTHSPVLVDGTHAARLGCSVDATWQVLPLPNLLEACALIADAHAPLR